MPVVLSGQNGCISARAGEDQPGHVAEVAAVEQFILDVGQAYFFNFGQSGHFNGLGVIHDDLQINLENTMPLGGNGAPRMGSR